jgi:mRNA interferase RelE/StbE
MRYQIQLKPWAIKDLKQLDGKTRRRLVAAIEDLENDLAGNVKRLTNFTPEYRLRVGNYRVLFEVEGTRVIVYRIKHRKDAYQ